MAAAVVGRCCIILGAVKVCPLIPGPIHVVAGIFPKFLFKEGSLTLMYMASLMFLAKPCDSLSTMEKHSGLTGGPVADVCRYVGKGAFRCSFYLSPSVLPDSPMYCSVQFIFGHLYL